MIGSISQVYWFGFAFGAAVAGLIALGLWMLRDLLKRAAEPTAEYPAPPESAPWVITHTDSRCCAHVCVCGYGKTVAEQADWSVADV